MIKLERSEALQKIIRRDDVMDLTIPDWDLVSEAIKAGKTEEALDFLKCTRVESQTNNDGFVSFVEMALTQLASFGEEELLKLFRQLFFPSMSKILSVPFGVEEALQTTSSQRRHHANFTITEEPDRYVVRYDPCGSGGRLRRTRSVGITKQAYPWSWGKAGVPYFCCHCCIHWEILPPELRSYPVRVFLIGDRPDDPCIHYFYKKPELIPEEYFARIGMTKTIK